jgi:hypothetical protein
MQKKMDGAKQIDSTSTRKYHQAATKVLCFGLAEHWPPVLPTKSASSLVYLYFCYYVFIGGLFIAPSCWALETVVSSAITENTTWDLSGSPYRIVRNVIINEGVVLTIVPGVVVRFESEYVHQIDFC